MLIGITGALFTLLLAPKSYQERPNIKNVSILSGAAVGGIGMYFVFVPVVSVFYHSTTAILSLLLGLFAPWVASKIVNKSEAHHA